jgi:Glycosyl transferase family 2
MCYQLPRAAGLPSASKETTADARPGHNHLLDLQRSAVLLGCPAYDPQSVSLLRVEGRKGKTACQNSAASVAKGEVLVFTDATTELDSLSARRLVEYLADPTVGCVAGRLVYVTREENATGRNSEAHWDYELRLRAAESAFGSLMGVSACLYAVRPVSRTARTRALSRRIGIAPLATNQPADEVHGLRILRSGRGAQ